MSSKKNKNFDVGKLHFALKCNALMLNSDNVITKMLFDPWAMLAAHLCSSST